MNGYGLARRPWRARAGSLPRLRCWRRNTGTCAVTRSLHHARELAGLIDLLWEELEMDRAKVPEVSPLDEIGTYQGRRPRATLAYLAPARTIRRLIDTIAREEIGRRFPTLSIAEVERAADALFARASSGRDELASRLAEAREVLERFRQERRAFNQR